MAFNVSKVKIVHRFFSNGKADFKELIDRLQIPHEYTENIIGKTVSFEISECDIKWPLLEEHLHKFDVSHSVGTTFSKKEINSADWLMASVGEYQYPQPEENWGQDSYNYSNACPECSVGHEQKEPIRLKSDFKQRRASFFGIHWIFDAVFTRPATLRILEEQFDSDTFSTMRAIHHKRGKPIEDLMQLVMPVLKQDFVIDSDMILEKCDSCGTVKRVRKERGMLECQEISTVLASPIFLTKEWFGSGHSAYRRIIVSNRFMKFIEKSNLRGFKFDPVKIIEDANKSVPSTPWAAPTPR